MAVNLAGDRLPCGHDIDQLWDHLVRDAPDEHARSCEHCPPERSPMRAVGRSAVPACRAMRGWYW